MTLTEANKQTARFLQPINDIEPGIEHAEKTLNELIHRWRRDLKPNLKLSTQTNYEWAYRRAQKVFGRVPVAELDKSDVQGFLTAAVGEGLSPESVGDLRGEAGRTSLVGSRLGLDRSGS